MPGDAGRTARRATRPARSAPRTGRSTPPVTRRRSPTASARSSQAGYMPPWPASNEGRPARALQAARPEDVGRDRQVGRRPAVRSTCPRRRRSRCARSGRPAAAARRRDEDAPGVRRLAQRTQRLPLLRARSAHHEADVHDGLRGHARRPRRDPPRRRSSTATRRRRPRASPAPARTASPAGAATRPVAAVDGRRTRPPTRRGPAASPGQAGLVAGWVPGQDPVVYPQHSGILMQPGDVLVLQMHYHYDTTPDARPHDRRAADGPGEHRTSRS